MCRSALLSPITSRKRRRRVLAAARSWSTSRRSKARPAAARRRSTPAARRHGGARVHRRSTFPTSASPPLITAAVGRVRQRQRTARAGCQVEREGPLVVLRLTAVRPKRILLTLAPDAHHAAHHRTVRRRQRLHWLNRRLCAWSCGIRWLLSAADTDDLELPVLRHRIFVFFAKIPAIHEHVDARRERIRDVLVLEAVESDRARVLFTPKHQLGFSFATGLLTPDRHRHRHQNCHNCQCNQQGRHRVAPLAALTM